MNAARNPDCGPSNAIDAVMDIIGTCSDPDTIVKALPYYLPNQQVVFILPE
ncbi:hypothetical protein HY218_00445 [Candidatus Saccharibacteria bacterium]|nr:hypothetical protein [Candidatus Saccharibacteria bacterium]